MTVSTKIELAPVARELGLKREQVEAVADLLEQGNTVPFITRYRRDQTGGLDEEILRELHARITRLKLLVERKQTILRSIDSQGKLTPELMAAIEAAQTHSQLEDLYLPYKPRKQTLATSAREKGLELLADEILSAAPSCAELEKRAGEFVNPDRGINSAAEALLGAGHILAESFSERAPLRQQLREIVERSGHLASAAVDPAAEAAKPFRDYFEYREGLRAVPPHRILALNRGERIKAIRIRLDVDQEAMQRTVDEAVAPADHPHGDFLRACGRDALDRLIFPSLEREVRRELTDRAEAHAVQVFVRNLRNLLLQPPVRDKRVLAIDPGFKSGSKLAVLDEFGQLVEPGLIHLVGKEERREQAKTTLIDFITRHNVAVVAIGNGTGCRETELLVAEVIASEPLAGRNVAYTIVNEAGASVYSASPAGREELPNLDATVRGTISIGRRLQDPLSELVKIEPPSLGVGMYQHDIKARHLRSSLDDVVESCVNFVGVDVNSASPALLRYVSGLNQLTARRLFDHRVAHGPFQTREQLKEVPGLGDATFVQAAGFLKISGGPNPFDSTWIHPESYEIARTILERLHRSPADLASGNDGATLAEACAQLDLDQLASELHVGRMLLEDIVSQLCRPGRDPRENLPPPMFKREVLKLEDLAPGMELQGTVLNVVDFGAFVDIGLKDTGLVHVSQLSSRYVRDPHEVVAVGDPVKVWVLTVDKDRRRVSLTLIPPGTPPRGQRGGGDRRERQGGRPGGPAHAGAAQGAAPAEGQTAAQGEEQRTGDQRPQGQHPQGQRSQGQHPQGQRPQGQRPQGQRRDQGGRGQGGQAQGGRDQRGGRPPAEGGRQGGRHQRDGGRPPRGQGDGQRPPTPRPPAKPKPPPPPITKKMREGKEPLRTFGDLIQFMDLKKAPPPEPTAPANSPPPAEAPPAHVPSQAPPPAVEEAPPSSESRIDNSAPSEARVDNGPPADQPPAPPTPSESTGGAAPESA